MNERRNIPDDMTSLETWLDHATQDDRAHAARDPKVSDSVRAALAAQRTIDAALRRQFSPPADSPPITGVDASPRASAGAMRHSSGSPALRRWAPLAAAAIVVLGLGTVALRVFWPSDAPSVKGPPIAMDVQYRDEVASGYSPYWICRTSQEFTQRFKSRFGHGLNMADPPPGIKAEGMDYVNSISPKTVCVLGRVQEQPVMVFVDLAANDRNRPQVTDPKLHLFNRTVGPYVLYELTPLDAPAMLDLFSAPSA